MQFCVGKLYELEKKIWGHRLACRKPHENRETHRLAAEKLGRQEKPRRICGPPPPPATGPPSAAPQWRWRAPRPAASGSPSPCARCKAPITMV